MPLPSTTIDIAFETFLQELPQDYWDLAYEFKAFCRARKIKTPAELMRVVMSYCGLDQVLREAAGTFTLLNESISDTAIHKRLKGCVPWVKAVLERLIGAGAQALIEGRLRWVVVDATSVQGPGARGTGARVHVAIDLVRLHLIAVTVTDQHQGESLDQYPLQEGDVVVMDRGYHSPREFVHWGAQGVCFVARYHWHNMNVYTAKQQKYDSVARVKTASSDQWCEPVRIRYQGEYLEAWLHAQRLPGEQAALARARVRKAAQKKGRTVSADALLMAEWVMVLTTVPPELLPTETITALYRLRWQVGVPGEGPVIQSVKVRPRPRDSSLVAWEAPWRESKTVKPSDNVHLGCTATHQVVTCSERRSSLVTRNPVAETVYNARRQQGLIEMSPIRRPSPAGYQRRHDAKDYRATGEALGIRRRKPVEEAYPITVSGKWGGRYQGGGSGRSTDDRRAAKRARREGPGPVGMSFGQREVGVR